MFEKKLPVIRFSITSSFSFFVKTQPIMLH